MMTFASRSSVAAVLTEDQTNCCTQLHSIAKERGVSLFAVGGIVRDLLRGVNPGDRDLDIVVEGDALEFARVVQGSVGGKLDLFRNFLTAKVTGPEGIPGTREIDFASTRTEIYRSPGTLPEVALSDLHHDLKRRDFSINAIALPLSVLVTLDIAPDPAQVIRQSCIDHFEGVSDLDLKLVRILHPKSFEDDPTRLFRALRYESRIGGELEKETNKAFARSVQNGDCAQISFRRQINEIVKMLGESESAAIVGSAVKRGLLQSCPTIRQMDAQFTSLLKALADLPLATRNLPGTALRDALFMGVIHVSSESERERRFQDLSISKEQRGRFIQELSLVSGKERGEGCTPAGLLLYSALNPNDTSAVQRLLDLAHASGVA